MYTINRSSESAGIYQLSDKDQKVEEPHVLQDGESGRELGSNHSSTMSMEGEGSPPPAPAHQEEIDLETIDHFRCFREVDNELVKKIMKIDLNETVIANKRRSMQLENLGAPAAKNSKKEGSSSIHKASPSEKTTVKPIPKTTTGTGNSAPVRKTGQGNASERLGRYKIM